MHAAPVFSSSLFLFRHSLAALPPLPLTRWRDAGEQGNAVADVAWAAEADEIAARGLDADEDSDDGGEGSDEGSYSGSGEENEDSDDDSDGSEESLFDGDSGESRGTPAASDAGVVQPCCCVRRRRDEQQQIPTGDAQILRGRGLIGPLPPTRSPPPPVGVESMGDDEEKA